MGLFRVVLEVAKPGRKAKWVSVPKVLVDTGSEATWLPEEILKKLNVDVFKKDQVFVMANGQTVSRSLGILLLRCGPFKTVDEVVFARSGDLYLLGAHTLEGFRAQVDSFGKRLVAAGPIVAA